MSVKINRKQQIILLIATLFIIFLVFNLRIHLTGFKDDGTLFLDPLKRKFDGNYIDFLISRYNTWSSRTVIELFTLISVTHPLVWKILNAVMMLTGAVFPAFILHRSEEVRVLDIGLSAALFLTFPISFFSETGWIATSTNYLWVYSLGMLAIYPIVRYLRGERTPKWLYFIGFLATIYASNHEQMAVLLLGFLVVFGGYLLIKKRRLKPLVPTIGMDIIGLIFVLTAKGNDIRYQQEVKNWFPDFEQLSLFKKFELGYSATLRHLFFDNQLSILLFTLLLFVFTINCFVYRKRFSIIGLFGLVPFVVSLPFSLNYVINNQSIMSVLNMFNQYGTVFHTHHPKTWIPDIILSIILFSILLSIIYLMDYQSTAYLPLLFICAAIAVRMLMGFSPTIWASATRTYLFSYGLFSFSFLYIFRHCRVFKASKLFMTFVTIILALYSIWTAFGSL